MSMASQPELFGGGDELLAQPTLREQVEEAALHALGLRGQIDALRDLKRRPPEGKVERLEQRALVAEAAHRTLADLASQPNSRRAS